MRRGRVILGAVLALGVSCAAPPAVALMCETVPVREHIDNNDIIFYGQIAQGRETRELARQGILTLKVLRAFKGVAKEQVRIRYEDLGQPLKGDLPRDWTSMIFARKSPAALPVPDVDGYMDPCSGNGFPGNPALHHEYWDILIRGDFKK